MSEVHERISVLEVKYENMEKSLNRLETTLSSTGEMIAGIKERLDKQNGAIPHLVDDVKSLVSKLEIHMEEEGQDMKSILVKMQEKKEEEITNSVKMKFLWAAAIAIATGMLGYVFKGFIG